MITDPAEEWEYRGIQCVLYRYPKPDGALRLVGYVEIGDVWIEAVDIDDDVGDADHAKRQIEETVDTALNDAVSAVQNDNSFDPIDVDPSPWPPGPTPPNPEPEPILPHGPTWTTTKSDNRSI